MGYLYLWENVYMNTLPIECNLLILFVFGSCIGSFLSVCIERWPKEQSIVQPASYCPYCQKKIPWYLNIPIFAWLFLRGKTACCGKKIPIRYFLSEIFIGLLAISVYFFHKNLFLPYFSLLCLLWVAFWTDVDTMLIPDEVTLLGIVIGILMSYFYPNLQGKHDAFQSMLVSLQGVCWGMGGLVCFISFVEFFLKKEAMGFGDVKLIGCIGAFCGWQGCLFSLFAGAIIGTFTVLCWGLFQIIIRKKKFIIRDKCIPFGPFLTIAVIIYVFFEKNFFEILSK